jgi:Rieske 2Fe-2S family protein
MTTTDLPASLISTLPGHYYTDPAVSALKQSRHHVVLRGVVG